MHHNPSHIFMFNLLHLLFSMQSSNESLHYFQMTFTRQYDLSLNRMEFNLFVLEKIKFQYTLRERDTPDNPVSIFIWIHAECVWMPFILVMHTEFCCIAGCCCRHFMESFLLLCCSICLEHVMQFNSSYSTKEFHSVARVRVQIIRWIFCAFCVRVFTC